MLPLTIAGRKGDDGWIGQLIDTVGLGDRLTHKPAELSGGQQQRVAVARALASRPAVLFADEPTGNLDSRTGEEVLQLLRHSCDDLGQTIVMVTHDAHAATFADRIVFLKDGAIAHDCGRLGRDEVYDVIKSLEDAAMIRIALAQSRRAQAADCPHDAGHPARRRDDQRHLRAHRPDRPRLQADLHRRLQGHRRDRDAQGVVHRRDGGSSTAGLPAVDGRAGARRRRRRRGLRATWRARAPSRSTARSSRPAAPRRSSSAVEHERPERHELRPGQVPDAPRRGRHHREARQRQEAHGRLAHHGDHRQPAPQQATVSGVFTFGAESSLGGSLLLNTTLADAQKWFDLPGRVSEIDVKAEAGTSAETLAGRIRAALPKDTDVKTGEQAAADQTKQMSDAIGSFLKPALLVLRRHRRAGRRLHHLQRLLDDRRPAAPRVRHAARARRLAPPGPDRGHRRERSAWASSPRSSASSPGSASPPASTSSSRRSAPTSRAAVSCWSRGPSSSRSAVGIIVTLLSAVVPALRATRVPPMAALQRGRRAAAPRASPASRPSRRVAVAVLGAPVHRGRHVRPAAGPRRSSSQLALGAVLVFVAVAMVSKYFVRPVARRARLAAARGSRPSAAASRATTAAATRRAPRPPPRRS